MIMRLRSIALLMPALTLTRAALAQAPAACECTDPRGEAALAPDTIFHVREGFDVAFCGTIDRSVGPYVYSGTMRSCGLVGVPIQVEGTLQACLLSVANSKFIVESLCMLPTG